jgi:threonine/homoserine/homoserine lactone efflux protein
VLLQGIGAGLPAALAIALSPFPVVGIVLILAGPRARLNGPAFAAGWVLALSVVAAGTVILFGGAEDPDSNQSAIAAWSKVLAGAALIALGLRTWRSRPRSGDEVDPPKWMASLDTVTPSKAFGLGALLAGANPKNLVLTAAAATSMAEVGADGTELVVAVIVFVLVSSVTVAGAVLLRLFGGERGSAALEGLRRFMVDNSAVISVVVLLLLGAKILGDGLAGLGR